MNFLGSLGIDLNLLIAQVVNFSILLWILTKFLYKPIIKRIEKDEAELKDAQEQSKILAQEKLSFSEQKKSEISQAKKRAKEIISEAEKIATQIKDRASKTAQEEKKAVIKQIKNQLAIIKKDEEKE